jgi:hypothetical protein
MTTLRDRRLDAENTINRLSAQREGCIASLIRYEDRLKIARRKLDRLKRAAIKALEKDAATLPPSIPVPPAKATTEITNIPVMELPIADDSDIPTFLDRRKIGDQKDKEAAAKIAAEQAERKTLKARGRIAKMKAKQNGETRKMPLTGRAALEAIRR